MSVASNFSVDSSLSSRLLVTSVNSCNFTENLTNANPHSSSRWIPRLTENAMTSALGKRLFSISISNTSVCLTFRLALMIDSSQMGCGR